MPPRKKTSDKQSFETKLQLLEALVEKMEGGELSLSETLDAYEQGMKLSQDLSKELDVAESRILELTGGKETPVDDVL